VCRRILGPVYGNEKENWRIVTDTEIYVIVKKTYHNRDNKVTKIMLVWACTENVMETEFSNKVLYMNLETTSLRGRARNRWKHEVRENGRLLGGEGWQEKIYN
jgi:hypothetical protein